MPNEQGTVALNNYLQSRNQLTSLTWVDTTSGPKHAPEWKCVCKISGVERGVGTGTHKHIARNQAAAAALKVLTEEEST